MKRILWLFIIFSIVELSAENFSLQLNLGEGVGVANPAGNTYNITYLEVEGSGSTGCCNLGFQFAVNEIFGARDVQRKSVQPGSYQVQLRPLLSLNKFLDADLKYGPVREWYIAGLYRGRAGYEFSGDFYAIGLGTDLTIPLIEKFSFNFYKIFEHINQQKNGEWKVSFEDSGWLAEVIWEAELKQIAADFNLSYIGNLTFGFGNNWAEKNYLGPDDSGVYVLSGTSSEFQMFNGFFWNTGKWSISTSFKLQNHCDYRDSKNHDKLSFWFGLHRRF